MREYIVPKEFEHYRLDQFLVKKLPALSRSFIQKIIKKDLVSINGKKSGKVANSLIAGDKIELDIPAPKRTEVIPEDIPLDVVYEDKDLIVINKPAGMVVHPAQGNKSGTLVNALLSYCKDLSGIGGVERPGIVHRLDKETSGLMVIAKTDTAHRVLSNMFKDRKVKKKYIALVHGIIKEDNGTIDVPIGRSASDRKKMAVIKVLSEKDKEINDKKHRKSKSRNAVTHFNVIKKLADKTVVELTLETGRTHQIRVHLAYIHHPIVGDKIYGYKKDTSDNMYLHSCELGFDHPLTGEYMEFKKQSDIFKRLN